MPRDGNYTFGWTTVKLGHSSGSRLVIRRLRGSTYTNLVDSAYSTTSTVRYTSESNTTLLRKTSQRDSNFSENESTTSLKLNIK